jgi:diguanylate cyclase (GGDEF)-like protein/PAS domain S-box-containing protein
MSERTLFSARRAVTFAVAFSGLMVSVLVVGTIFTSRFSQWTPRTEYLMSATPALLLFSYVALRKMRQEPGPGNAEEQAATTLADARFLAATESSLDAFFLLDAVRGKGGAIEDFSFTYLNRKARQLFGMAENRGIGDHLCELYPSFHMEALYEQFSAALVSSGQSTGEFAIKEKCINARWVRSSVLKLGNGVAVTASDLTEAKQQEAATVYVAHHDALTGLANETLLNDRLQQAIERAKRNQGFVALLLLDVDGLGEINQRFGHGVGDYVLMTVAQRMHSAVRASDSIFRLNGRRFAVLYSDVPVREPASTFARKIMLSLSSAIMWQKNTLSIAASIGLAIYPDAASAAEMIEQADLALHRTRNEDATPKLELIAS